MITQGMVENRAAQALAPRPGALSRLPAIALAVSLGILAALAIIPTTRWIVRRQAGLNIRDGRSMAATLQSLGIKDFPMDPVKAPPNEGSDLADRYGPNNLQLQIAGAVSRHYAHINFQGSTVQTMVQGQSAGDEIRKLKAKFGDNASIYANAIRHDAQNRIRLNREQDEEFFTGSGGSSRFSSHIEATPEQLAQFLKDCEAGERLEPQNGYFTMLRAAGLFSARRDSEALAALHKAAGQTAWEPHYSDEAEGVRRLTSLSDGDDGALHRMAAQAGIIFPELALLRSTARVSLAKAIQAELSGRRDEGLRVRMDVAHCGALMRSEAPSTIANLVGIAITRMTASRPGGAKYVDTNLPGSAAQVTGNYLRYVRALGARRDADWYQTELNYGVSAQGAAMSGIYNSPAGLNAVVRLSLLWVGGTAVFGNIFWLLAAGIVGSLYIRRWKARQAAGWVREDTFVVLVGGCCILLGMGLIGWSQAHAAYSIAETGAALSLMSGGGYSQFLPAEPGAVRLIALAIMLTIPVVLVVMALIVAAVRRRPLLITVARSLRAVGLTIAALLMVGYAVIVSQTARREAEMNTALTGIEQHEARFMAKSVGATLPPLKHE